MAIRRREDWRPVDIGAKLWTALRTNYHLGFTSFGGPPVHFKIVSCSLVLTIMLKRAVYCICEQDDC